MRLLLKITTVITLIILGNINSALAQNEHPGFDINTVVVNYMSAKVQDSRLSPLGNNLMGEQHDLDTGILSFRHVDVSLPGNSDIPVEFGRQTNIVSFLANGATHKGVLGTSWATNTPYVRVRGDTGQTGNCRATISDYRAKEAFDIGTKVKLLSGGEQSAGPHLKSFGLVLCKSGGGFLVKTPNGHTYEMTKKFIYTDTYDLNDPNLQPNSFVLDNAFWHVTKITDAHNNWVQYSYNQYGVNRVWSNDGREITMSYTNDLITQVTTNGRNWLYSYTKADALSRVTLPDGRYWSFGHDEAGMASVNSPIGDACEVDHGRTLHLKHPSGTKARFRLSNHFNVYKNVPSQPVTYGSGSTNNPGTGSKCAPGNIEPYSFAVYALVNKKLTLTNGKEAVWRYEYDERLNANSPNRNDMVDEKTRTIINPEGNKVVHYINRVYNGPQGMTMKVEYFENEASNIPIRVESVDEYVLSEFSSFGDRGLKGSTRTGKIHTLPTRKVIIQNGDTFTTEYDYDFDENSPTFAYTQPIETLSWSNYSISGESNKRIKKTQYEHNTNKWILNLPKTMHQNGRLIWSVDYTAEGEVHKAYEYNQPLPNAKYDYYSNGTVSKVTDALERVTEVANWKRGKPQLITRNDGFSISLSLDDNGWIMSQTDAKGRTTAYQRDSMGRLTRITPHTPIAGEGGYKLPDTTIHYTFGDTTVQMITTGSKRDFVYYDSLFRPYLDLTYDRQTNKKVMNYTGYDALGRVTFKSQPSDVWGVTKGTDISYDALGRITESRENVAPYATTTHEYLNYHRKKVTDPEGNAVTTYQYGWDGPDSGVPYLIRQHGVTDTWIRRNEHGEIWRVDQTGSSGGVSVNQKQHFYYDSNRRLCRTRTPEGGDTIYQYNHANELTGYIKGQSASAYCPDQISGNAKVTLTYDDLGRLENTLYTDPNTPDITRDYDLNGNITKLHRGSGADSVNWDYAYDGNDMLTDEELVVGGSKAFDIRYKYNALGHMYRKYLPSGKGLSYFNDGLGRHKKVSWGSATYADNASYHPSGPLESLTFGNDQVFTQTLNTRLMPERLKVSKNGTDVQNLYYDYYADGRIKHKLNYVDSTYSAIHFYDSAGRLEQANSAAWGGASFKYDPLGNLREKTFSDWKGSARTVINNYDSRNRISGTTDPRRITYGFNHDNRGNVIKTGNLSFTYDMSDQPVAMTGDAPTHAKILMRAISMTAI